MTPFKPVFDPHAPSHTMIMGSMNQPRGIDFVRENGGRLLFNLGDRNEVFKAVTSLHDVHPFAHVVAGANNSGRISVWRKP